jgi:AraC-like DNA-binding protein
MLQDQYQEVLGKVGMQPRGGCLTKIPCIDPAGGEHKGSAAWACPGIGLFILDHADRQAVDLDAIVARDLLVCAVVLNDASTGFAVGKRRLDVEGSDMIMIFVPRGERFRFSTTVKQGLKAVTIVVDLESMRTSGFSIATLPKSLFEIIERREIVIEALAPGHFGTVAADVIARRGMFPSLARPYYNGKALELFSTLLSQISRRDAIREDRAIDPKLLARLCVVKQFIEQAQHRTLDVDGLGRIARMNRTKLRAAFKQAFGMTLSDYRTALMLRRADRALKEAGCTVQEAAHRAGYASASSFIVAYKRHYGVRPGDVRC